MVRKLEGKIALVTGATGIVGSGVARRLLEEGATVIAPIRSEAKTPELLEELKGISYPDNHLKCPVCECGTADGVAQLAEFIKTKFGTVDVVVSSYGGSVPIVPLSQLSSEGMQKILARAEPHATLAQHITPLLKQDPTTCYMIVTGMLGENCFDPKYAGLTVANATIYGIVQALIAEQSSSPIRINEIRIAALLKKPTKEGHPFMTTGRAYSSAMIGDVAVDLACGMEKSQIVRVRPDQLEAKLSTQ